MAEVPARAVFTATTLWRFKVLDSKQAVVFYSQTTLKCFRLPAWKSQSLPWQDSPESQHFKTAQLFFSCYGWKPKSMHLVFYQHRLSVLWQDLLMSYKVLQLKLSQEASLRWERLLASSKQSRPEKLLPPRKHALLYSFPNFLRLSVDSVIHVGAIRKF